MVRKAIRAVFVIVALLVLGGIELPISAGITIRTQEPIVLEAAQFPAFEGVALDRIRLYVYTATGWARIPAQIDEWEVDDLYDNISDSGCRYEHEACELGYVLQGVNGDGFTAAFPADELAFMARDVVGVMKRTNYWVGTPGLTTMNVRYQILVKDHDSGETGYVYAYAWITDPPTNPIADYVRWDESTASDPCTIAEHSTCGWFRSNDVGSIANTPRFNVFYSGKWAMETVCVKPYANDTTCTVNDSQRNILDITKWRTTNPRETEHGWDSHCATFLGVKDGPVRVLRRTQGAASGKFTTKLDVFYGTWLEETVNLRVHEIGSIRIANDHRSINPDPEHAGEGEDPKHVFTMTKSSLDPVNYPNVAMDEMNAEQPMPAIGEFGDWLQIDTSRGTYLQFIREDRQIPDAQRSFDYLDYPQSETHENQVGMTYGQFGHVISGAEDCLGDTQDFECRELNPEAPDLNFARLVRTLIPLAVDAPSGNPLQFRSEEGAKYETYRTNKPLVAAVYEQQYAETPGDPTPVNPCKPTLGGTADPNGDSVNLNVGTSQCDPGIVGSQIYRGYIPGSYSLIKDIGARAAHWDLSVLPGVTYRYVARTYDRDGALGPNSDELVLTTVDTEAPPVPTGIAAVAGPEAVTVSWSDPGGGDLRGVQVYISTTPGSGFVQTEPDPVQCGGTSRTITGLSAGQNYFFVVRSIDGVGNESDDSVEVSAVPY